MTEMSHGKCTTAWLTKGKRERMSKPIPAYISGQKELVGKEKAKRCEICGKPLAYCIKRKDNKIVCMECFKSE